MVVGRVGRPHGVRGEVTVLPAGGDPGDFARGAFLQAGERELRVRSARPYRDRGLIVGFSGIDSRAAAEALRGAILTRPTEDRRPLDQGEFWTSDLVGVEAVRRDGRPLGRVVEVITGGHQDRLVVLTPSGDEVHVPFVEEFVGDPAGGRIVTEPPEGLFPG